MTVPAVSGVAAAHFPAGLEVDVVADGDGARPRHGGHVEDVDGDGSQDLVLHFPVDGTGFDGDEEEGLLHWERDHRDAHHGRSGSDDVRIVGNAR